MTDGTISRHYPKDLESLFKLDGKLYIYKIIVTRFLNLNFEAETTKALMSDYKLPTSDSNSQDHNLNRFLQFCGVQYQLVE